MDRGLKGNAINVGGIRDWLGATLLMLVFAVGGWARTEASIAGTVADGSGAPVAGAKLMVRNLETNTTRKTTTDEAGRYSVASLPVGRYEVEAELPGFKSELRTGISLAVGQGAVVDLKLQVGEITQQVTVKGDASLVDTTTNVTTGLVDEKRVKELPLNGRSYDELVTLNPGIVNYTAQRSGGAGVSNSSIGNMFAVGGASSSGECLPVKRHRVHQRERNQPAARRGEWRAAGSGRHPGIQRHDRRLRRGVWKAAGRPGEYRDGFGQQPVARLAVRTPAQ
ncbi:MAG: carboxypeptidase-like regulatory domain-containing protein [Candidatus Acidiferrales bacterium]